MGRLSARGSVLEVDFAQATLSWDFRGPSGAPLRIVCAARMLVRGTECFAVSLQGEDGTAEIRVVCPSASVLAPTALTVLIVECDPRGGFAPTAICAAAGAEIAPGLAGKTILAVGTSDGRVMLFDINQVFRLGPCRENHLRTGDTSVVSWDDFRTFCGRPVLGFSGVTVGMPASTANATSGGLASHGVSASSHTASSPIIALHFIPPGGCLRQAHLAAVCGGGRGEGSGATLVLANLSADPSRTRTVSHPLTLAAKYEQGYLSFCDLCHVHMAADKDNRLSGRTGHTLLWVVSDHVAVVLQPGPGGANPRSGVEPRVDEAYRFETAPASDSEFFLGVVSHPSNMCVLMRTSSGGDSSVRVDLIDLLGNEDNVVLADSVSVDVMEQLPSGFKLASRGEIRASTCVQCETSRSLTKAMPPSQIEFVKVSTPILSREITDRASSSSTSRHHQWVTAVHVTPRAQAIKEIEGLGRDILTLSDDAFVSRLATDYNGIGLDDEASGMRSRIRQSRSVPEVLSGTGSFVLNKIPILRDVLAEIIADEARFADNHDNRAHAHTQRSKAVLDAVLDTGRIDIICSLLVRADGRVWQSVNLWVRELLVVYAVLLDQCISGPSSACIGDASATTREQMDSAVSVACSEKMARFASVFRGLRSIFEASLDTVQEAFEGYGSEADLHSLSSTAESMFDMANVCLWFLNYSSSETVLSFDALHSVTTASVSMPEGRRARRGVESRDASELIGGGDAVFEGGEDYASVQASSSSHGAPLLFGEELALLVERGCPGTIAVLQSGYEAFSKPSADSPSTSSTPAFFPPRRFRDLMYMFLVGEEAMVGKSCLALYTALDLCYVAMAVSPASGTTELQNRELAYAAEDFASMCGIDEPTKTAVLALWHIDNHGDVHLAVDLLLSEDVALEPGWHFKVVRAVADGWTSGRDALHYMRSLGLKPTTTSEAIVAVRLLLQCGSWEEAFDAQRKICDRFLGSGELGARLVWHLRQTLIGMCFRWLMTTPQRVQFLLRLPVRNGDEETALTQFLTLASFGKGRQDRRASPAALGVLLAHLVFHSKIEEARCIEAIASVAYKDGIHGAKPHDVALGRIMESFKSLSPAASRLSQDRSVAAAVAESQKRSGVHSISSTVLSVLRGVFKLNGPSSLETQSRNEDASTKVQQFRSDYSESLAQSFATNSATAPQNQLRTPAKSLLRVAATSNPKDFARRYSPSLLSPVVKGLSPFSTGPEVTKGISDVAQKRKGLPHTPSTPSGLRTNTSLAVADRIISEMDRNPPRRASLTYHTNNKY